MNNTISKFLVVFIALGVLSPKIVLEKKLASASLISGIFSTADAETGNSQAGQINKYRENSYRTNHYRSSYSHHGGYYRPRPGATGVYREVYISQPVVQSAPVVIGNCRVVYMEGVRYRDCGNGNLIRY